MNTNGSDLPLDAVKLHRERRRAALVDVCCPSRSTGACSLTRLLEMHGLPAVAICRRDGPASLSVS